MTAEEFDGPALVLGSVRGRRSFGLTTEGRLTGVFYDQVWHPGENRASCLHDGGVVVRLPNGRSVVRGSYSREIGPAHRLQGCTCGFYAYYWDDPYARHRRISGIVEGYGRVILGTKGFRAEKARILALLLSEVPPRHQERASDWLCPERPGDALLDGATTVRAAQADLAGIRAAYPDVAVFARLQDMLAAFPPTVNGPEL